MGSPCLGGYASRQTTGLAHLGLQLRAKPRLHLYIIDGGRDTKTTDHSLMGVGKSSFMDEIIRPKANTGCGERIQDVADPGCGERGGGGGGRPSIQVSAGLIKL